MREMPEPRDVVFLSAVRTPFGTFGGKLKGISPVDLAVHASKNAIDRAGITPTDIDQTIFGNVLYTTNDSIYFARHVALKSGCRQETSALTLNRLCGSGFQAIVSGAQEIILGDAQVCLVGGAESMSQAPHVIRGARWGLPFGPAQGFEDRVEFVHEDMREVAERHVADCGAVINVGGLSNDPTAEFDPRANEELNHLAAVHLAEVARRAGVPRLIFASTASIYDRGVGEETRDVLQDEESDVAPRAAYATSKWAAEKAILATVSVCASITCTGWLPSRSQNWIRPS